MRKRVAMYVVAGLLMVAAWAAASVRVEAQVGCQGECWTCVAFECQSGPFSGHCSCGSGGGVGEGRYCVASGGTCIPTY
jgi:hypothetical protein